MCFCMHDYSVSYVTINPLKCVLHFYIIFRSMKNCVLHTLIWDMFITIYPLCSNGKAHKV